jgi:hypothetical protein
VNLLFINNFKKENFSISIIFHYEPFICASSRRTNFKTVYYPAEASCWKAPAGPQDNPQMVPQSYTPLAPCLISKKRATMTFVQVGDI